jgi:hypothetical protein
MTRVRAVVCRSRMDPPASQWSASMSTNLNTGNLNTGNLNKGNLNKGPGSDCSGALGSAAVSKLVRPPVELGRVLLDLDSAPSCPTASGKTRSPGAEHRAFQVGARPS